MNRGRLNLTLLAALGGVLGLALALSPDRRRPNFEFLPDMAHQPHFRATEMNPYFPDGATLRAPVEGTVARGHLPLAYGASPQEAVRAGEELRSPILEADRSAALARGEVLWRRFCVPCHGSEGGGDGPVVLRGVPPPPSLHTHKARHMADGQLFHILTFGQGNMPAYASQLTREDRWRVILFVRSLQEKHFPSSGEAQ